MIIVGLAQEWDTLLNAEKNSLLKQLVCRVTFLRQEEAPVAVEVHPLWEPDPWAGDDETLGLGETSAE